MITIIVCAVMLLFPSVLAFLIKWCIEIAGIIIGGACEMFKQIHDYLLKR